MAGQPSAPKRTAQLELNAANLAQQRPQPFDARMPRIRGKAGAKDLLPLGREGAVCSLCGMAGSGSNAAGQPIGTTPMWDMGMCLPSHE